MFTPLHQHYLDLCLIGDSDAINRMLRRESKKFNHDKFLMKCLNNACEGDHYNLCESLLLCLKTRSITQTLSCHLHDTLTYPCIKGKIDMFKLYISHMTMNNDMYRECLYGACQSGNLSLIKFILTKIFDTDHENLVSVISNAITSAKTIEIDLLFQMCLRYVCMSGNLENIDFITECAETIFHYGSTSWQWGLEGACMGNDIEIVELMISHTNVYDSWCFEKACEGGNMKIINYFIQTYWAELTPGFNGACKGGHIEIVKMIVEKTKTNERIIDSECMYNICDKNYPEIVKFLFEQGYRCNELSYYTIEACQKGHVLLAKIMIEQCIITNVVNIIVFEECMYRACSIGNHELVNFMIEKGCTNWNLGLLGACRYNHIELVKLMIKYGATNINDCLRVCEIGNSDYTDVIITLINNGATDINLLQDCRDFRLFRIFLRFQKATPCREKHKYLEYINKYPPFVLLTGREYSKNADCHIKRLPRELFVLLGTY